MRWGILGGTSNTLDNSSLYWGLEEKRWSSHEFQNEFWLPFIHFRIKNWRCIDNNASQLRIVNINNNKPRIQNRISFLTALPFSINALPINWAKFFGEVWGQKSRIFLWWDNSSFFLRFVVSKPDNFLVTELENEFFLRIFVVESPEYNMAQLWAMMVLMVINITASWYYSAI